MKAPAPATEISLTDLNEVAVALRSGVASVIVGKDTAVERLLVALLCEGHVLLEDVPGTGKTTLVRALARVLDCEFRRIQFTPDLLPSDVTGSSIFNQRTSDFEFRRGPIFTNLLLGDEINRAPPKTQAALLEAMQEYHATAAGRNSQLERPFFVLVNFQAEADGIDAEAVVARLLDTVPAHSAA